MLFWIVPEPTCLAPAPQSNPNPVNPQTLKILILTTPQMPLPLPQRLSSPAVRRIRLLASLAVASTLLVIAWQLLGILLPFLVSAILAYLLFPLIKLADRAPWARRRPNLNRALCAGLATMLVILIVLGVPALGVFRAVDGALALAERVPGMIAEGREIWEQIQSLYNDRVPDSVKQQIDPRLAELRAALGSAGLVALQRVSRIAQSGVSQVIGLAASPIILFYLLYQPVTLGRGVRNLLPGPLRDDLSAIARLAGQSIGAYIRMQLMLGFLVGVIIGLTLWAMGAPLALPLGALAGLAELLPIVGPIVFFVIAALAMALADLSKLPFVLLIYLGVQALQNTLIAPRMQGEALGLHPLAIILALAIFGIFFGFLGTLLAAPLTAAGYRVLTYARCEWNAAGEPQNEPAPSSDPALDSTATPP